MSLTKTKEITLEYMVDDDLCEQGTCESCMFHEATLQTEELEFCHECTNGYWRIKHELD